MLPTVSKSFRLKHRVSHTRHFCLSVVNENPKLIQLCLKMNLLRTYLRVNQVFILTFYRIVKNNNGVYNERYILILFLTYSIDIREFSPPYSDMEIDWLLIGNLKFGFPHPRFLITRSCQLSEMDCGKNCLLHCMNTPYLLHLHGYFFRLWWPGLINPCQYCYLFHIVDSSDISFNHS